MSYFQLLKGELFWFICPLWHWMHRLNTARCHLLATTGFTCWPEHIQGLIFKSGLEKWQSNHWEGRDNVSLISRSVQTPIIVSPCQLFPTSSSSFWVNHCCSLALWPSNRTLVSPRYLDEKQTNKRTKASSEVGIKLQLLVFISNSCIQSHMVVQEIL